MPTVSGKKYQNWSGGTLFGGPLKFSPSKIMTLVSICLEKYREPLLQVSSTLDGKKSIKTPYVLKV